MGFDRTLRVSEEIRRVVSSLIATELKDPRIAPMTTVTRVETTNDYKFCKIFISVIGADNLKKETLEGLNRAKGFIRKQIGSNIKLRNTPEPIFVIDESIEYGVSMSKLIDEVISKDESSHIDENGNLTYFNEPNLKEYNNIVIFPHIMPDGDTIGACVAMWHSLNDAGKNAIIVLDDKIPDDLKFLITYDDMIISLEDYLNMDFDVELYICIDLSNEDRLGDRLPLIEDMPVWNIDHHKTNSRFGDFHSIDSSSPASCQILFEILNRYELPISVECAESLYTGICTDTGSFKYESTSPKTLRIAADLLEYDIDRDKIIRELFQSKSKNVIKLNALSMSKLRYLADGKLVISYVDENMLKEADADMTCADGIVECLRDIKGVEVALFLKKHSDTKTKVSMRSKTIIDVAEIADSFGGGGHIRAAGFNIETLDSNEMNEKLKQLEELLVNEINENF